MLNSMTLQTPLELVGVAVLVGILIYVGYKVKKGIGKFGEQKDTESGRVSIRSKAIDMTLSTEFDPKEVDTVIEYLRVKKLQREDELKIRAK